jgi:hypothetical protein
MAMRKVRRRPGADPDQQREGVHRPVPPPAGRGAVRPDLPGERLEHLLTQPRSPTTTGKIERFHRTLRAELDTTQVFRSLAVAQQALDEWVGYYNTDRPHQSVDDQPPAARFHPGDAAGRRDPRVPAPRADRTGEQWMARTVGANGVVCVSWQQVSVGKHYAGSRCDVLVTDGLLQFWVGNQLLKTVKRASTGDVRKKNAAHMTRQS